MTAISHQRDFAAGQLAHVKRFHGEIPLVAGVAIVFAVLCGLCVPEPHPQHTHKPKKKKPKYSKKHKQQKNSQSPPVLYPPDLPHLEDLPARPSTAPGTQCNDHATWDCPRLCGGARNNKHDDELLAGLQALLNK